MAIVVLMGVCGSGKSTVGRCLSEKTGWPFVDADDHHPKTNKQKMAKGIPLNDEDRHGWLLTLHHILRSWKINNQSGILACSALKRSYREILCTGRTEIGHNSSEGTTDNAGTLKDSIIFVYLKGSAEAILSRMTGRDSHFMPVSLLDSQFKTLEEPHPEEGIRVLTEDICQPVEVIVRHILDFVSAQSNGLKL
ncbi:probable gluconokinase [Patiria miniata]|uniref:Gluconokinase n=1 Tax=Patiria miniata TaxID=46514 RepID=A0A914B9D3_PATMI|nr:probable gluconokinase [Patiria miniata]